MLISPLAKPMAIKAPAIRPDRGPQLAGLPQSDRAGSCGRQEALPAGGEAAAPANARTGAGRLPSLRRCRSPRVTEALEDGALLQWRVDHDVGALINVGVASARQSPFKSRYPSQHLTVDASGHRQQVAAARNGAGITDAANLAHQRIEPGTVEQQGIRGTRPPLVPTSRHRRQRGAVVLTESAPDQRLGTESGFEAGG